LATIGNGIVAKDSSPVPRMHALAAAGFATQVEIPLCIPFYEINRLVDEHACSVIVLIRDF
jgi:hypothetical protein